MQEADNNIGEGSTPESTQSLPAEGDDKTFIAEEVLFEEKAGLGKYIEFHAREHLQKQGVDPERSLYPESQEPRILQYFVRGCLYKVLAEATQTGIVHLPNKNITQRLDQIIFEGGHALDTEEGFKEYAFLEKLHQAIELSSHKPLTHCEDDVLENEVVKGVKSIPAFLREYLEQVIYLIGDDLENEQGSTISQLLEAATKVSEGEEIDLHDAQQFEDRVSSVLEEITSLLDEYVVKTMKHLREQGELYIDLNLLRVDVRKRLTVQ